MAEAADTPQPQRRFYCHCCKCETKPGLSDLVCPACESGFVEEVTDDSSLLQNSTPSSAGLPSSSLFSELLFLEHSALLSDPPSSESDSESEDGGDEEEEEEESAGQSVPSPASQVATEGGEQDSALSSESERSPWSGSLEEFLTDLLPDDGNPGATTTGLSSLLQLYSNPGDYAWGQGSLDTFITELFGQLENTGPPPAKTEMISSLPTVHVSQEQIDSRLECPICMEGYSLRESVRKLPCLHHFHGGCIVPWLELHDSCPVCRKSLDGVVNGVPLLPAPPEEIAALREEQEQQERQAI
ncbi:E3 ubiquitin-protein ligase RNF115 [Kryptolebias marmoratus]|uniref:RING-type E3 ubiquitin transferase n=1 Tax=Kryptolebias marmoratus TaxID=37003 RepID=A0A3Q3AI91_KRYMA|nr:E3 ubiquitin-protein ligase RNF115 [Kryptolebias marmoratus]